MKDFQWTQAHLKALLEVHSKFQTDQQARDGYGICYFLDKHKGTTTLQIEISDRLYPQSFYSVWLAHRLSHEEPRFYPSLERIYKGRIQWIQDLIQEAAQALGQPIPDFPKVSEDPHP